MWLGEEPDRTGTAIVQHRLEHREWVGQGHFGCRNLIQILCRAAARSEPKLSCPLCQGQSDEFLMIFSKMLGRLPTRMVWPFRLASIVFLFLFSRDVAAADFTAFDTNHVMTIEVKIAPPDWK